MSDAPVLICYDGTDVSEHAIDAAAGLLGKRRAVVVDIGPPLTPAESYAALGLPGTTFEELNLHDATDRATAGAEHALRAGFDAEGRGEVAAPTWEGIVAVADELDASVIVMGTRALTGARELVDGSVSHQVAQHSHRPVLIVPPPSS